VAVEIDAVQIAVGAHRRCMFGLGCRVAIGLQFLGALMLIGFAGLGFMAYRRTKSAAV
jgi:hypothetical protein